MPTLPCSTPPPPAHTRTPLVQVYLLLVRLGYYATRRWYPDQLAALSRLRIKFGEVAYVHVRTCWFDDVCEAFLRAQGPGAPVNLVVLGAGYDSHCYRFRLGECVACYEVDAPGTQAEKRQVWGITGGWGLAQRGGLGGGGA